MYKPRFFVNTIRLRCLPRSHPHSHSQTHTPSLQQLVFFSLHLFTYLFIPCWALLLVLKARCFFFFLFLPRFCHLSVLLVVSVKIMLLLLLPLMFSSRCARHVLHFSSYYACFCHLFNFIYIGPSFFVAVHCVYIQVYLIKLLFRFLLYVPLARLSFPLLDFFFFSPHFLVVLESTYTGLALSIVATTAFAAINQHLFVSVLHKHTFLQHFFFCFIYCAHSFTSNCTGILFCLYMYIHLTS